MLRLLSLVPRRALSSGAAPPAGSGATFASEAARNKFERPSPPPLPAQEQAEFRRLQKEVSDGDRHPFAPLPKKEHAQDFDGSVNPRTGEVNGPKGVEPTRYGDWERAGRVYDF
jgi:hypothetical protein